MTLFLRKNRREIIEFHEIKRKLCEGIDERLTFDLTKRPQSVKITSAQHTLQRIKFITVK